MHIQKPTETETSQRETETEASRRAAIQCRATAPVSECRDVPDPECQVPRPEPECRERPAVDPNAEFEPRSPAMPSSIAQHGIRHPSKSIYRIGRMTATIQVEWITALGIDGDTATTHRRTAQWQFLHMQVRH